MSPYFFTMAFLLMMSFLTSSEAIRFTQSSLESKCYLASRESIAAAEELRELSHLESLRNETNDEPKEKSNKLEERAARSKRNTDHAKVLGVNASRPPNNSRINLYVLLTKDKKTRSKEFSIYEITARLIKALYQEELLAEMPDAEYKILEKIMENKEEILRYNSPDRLTSLDLEDEKLQKIFHQMLKGTKKAPSLLNYLTLDPDVDRKQARKINLFFADPAIIHAIFPTGNVANQLIEQRNQIWAAIEDQEAHRLERSKQESSGRGAFAEQLKASVDEILKHAGLNAEKYKSNLFDCTLGKPGTVIFLRDPETGLFTRHPYTPPPKK